MRIVNPLVLGIAVGLAACEGTTGSQVGQVVVRLSDAPSPSIDSAIVFVSRVYLVGSDGTTQFTITSSGGKFNLLDLQGGITALLGTATIPVGNYEQLRLVVDSARLKLVSGTTFSDGSMSADLKVPSGPQTGIKVNFGGPVHIAPGQTFLVVDFSVSQSFVFTGPDAAPNGVLFKPVLHGTVQDQAGSISGTSKPAADKGEVFAINGTDTMSTFADDTGGYSFPFLAPGTYKMRDSATVSPNHVAPATTVTLNPQQHLTVNFTIP